MQMNPIPGLNAKSRVQPWALGSNAFGVESGTEAIIAGFFSQRPCRNLNKAAHSVPLSGQSLRFDAMNRLKCLRISIDSGG